MEADIYRGEDTTGLLKDLQPDLLLWLNSVSIFYSSEALEPGPEWKPISTEERIQQDQQKASERSLAIPFIVVEFNKTNFYLLSNRTFRAWSRREADIYRGEDTAGSTESF